ncbi:MAG: AcrVA2 family anti-CRISPR protein [Desulfomonilaceae bacterium]
MNVSRPSILLRNLSQDYPGIWKIADSFRADRGKTLPKWADWCFLPLAAAYAIVSACDDSLPPLDRVRQLPRIGALAAWRVTQGIYRFDKEILKRIWDTPVKGDLPIEIFFRLPQWCVYIELPEGTYFGSTILYGCFVHLEDDQKGGDPELRILADTNEGLLNLVLHLIPGGIEASLAATLAEANRHASKAGTKVDPKPSEEFVRRIEPIVSLILYLCSTGADIQRSDGGKHKMDRPQPQKTKKGLRYFPPARPSIFYVGYKLGEALRKAEADTEKVSSSGTHATPLPHIRRAHWHSFWKGPRNQPAKRYLVVYWLPPIPVGIQDLDELTMRNPLQDR